MQTGPARQPTGSAPVFLHESIEWAKMFRAKARKKRRLQRSKKICLKQRHNNAKSPRFVAENCNTQTVYVPKCLTREKLRPKLTS